MFDPAILSRKWKEAVCDRCVTGAPRTPFEQQYSLSSFAHDAEPGLRINPKTVAKWRKWATVEDLKAGPKVRHSTTLSNTEEAMVVAFCRYTLFSLDECLAVDTAR